MNAPTISRSAASDAPADAALYRRIAWRLLPFLVLCYIVNFVDRTNIGFAQLALKDQLGFSNAIYGLGAGLFYAGYVAFEVPSNLLMQRVGARRTIARILVLWGVLSMTMEIVRSPRQFYVLRFLLGAAEAGFMPGILFYLGNWVPAARRASFTALFMLAIPLSGLIGSPLSGIIMHSLDHVLALRGWQWMFLLEGSPALLLGIAAWFVLTDGPARVRWLSAEEKARVSHALYDARHEKYARGWSVMLDARLWLVALFCTAINGSIGGFSFWLPTIIRGLGTTSAIAIGWIAAAPYGLGALALFFNGRHSDRTMERRWHAAASLGLASGGWLLLPFTLHLPELPLPLVALATAGTLGALACFWSLIPLIFPRDQALAFAAVSSLGSFGSLASPIVVGWIASRTGSVFYGTLYLGALMLVAALALIAGTHAASQKKTRHR